MNDVLVTVDELAGLLAGSQPPVLLDVRWALGDPHGRDHYLAGHLPSAFYVDLDTELAGPASPASGRHPLPAAADFEATARRWGLRADDDRDVTVVAYDNTGNLAAARAWWLLRWAGVHGVRLLDGGLRAWAGAGYPVVRGPVAAPSAGDVVLKPGQLPVLDADETGSFAGILLDARPGERYRGEVEPVDSRPGHIPGAFSAPAAENLGADGRFKPLPELAERFSALGAEPGAQVGVYCGSGVTAAHAVAALTLTGVDAALYPGSWSQWSADPARPAATSVAPTRPAASSGAD
jgi:thiosulfate/3-mercaptopyruvate sulfurtransferase